MDRDSLAGLLQRISGDTGNSMNELRRIYEMALDHSLKDYEWTTLEVYTPLFQTILKVCDERDISRYALKQFLEANGEVMLWRVWRYMLESPNEFKDRLAADSSVVGEKFVACLLERLVSLSVRGLELSELSEKKKNRVGAVFVGRQTEGGLAHDSPAAKGDNESKEVRELTEMKRSVAACSIACKYLLHWLYCHRVDLRAFMRVEIGKKLLHVGTSGTASVKLSQAPVIKAGIGKDGGSSRLHVKPLLELLHSIIGGLSPADQESEGAATNTRKLLTGVLLPLHAPSEFVEWRDQTPVMAQYHEILVKCMLKLIDIDRRGAHSSVPAETVRGLIRLWPDGRNANTPKEVLFLHEVETIVSHLFPAPRTSPDNRHHSSSVSEVQVQEQLPEQGAQVMLAELLQQEVLQAMVRGIEGAGGGGGGVDIGANIRPAQRTLQMFRNKGVLRFLSLSYPAVLRALLPVLYQQHSRDSGRVGRGALSWNPTVNKMMGLALEALRGLDMHSFDRACDSMFGDDCPAAAAAAPPADGASSNTKEEDERRRSVSGGGGDKHEADSRMMLLEEDEDEDGEDHFDMTVGRGIATSITRSRLEISDRKQEQEQERDRKVMPPPLSKPPLLHRQQQQQQQGQVRAAKRPFNPATVMPGSMRPPLRAPGGGAGLISPGTNPQPPSRGTIDISRLPSRLSKQLGKGMGGGAPPPVTITGVAPWANMSGTASVSAVAQAKDSSSISSSDGGSSGGDGWGGEGSKFVAPDSSSKRDEGEGEGGDEWKSTSTSTSGGTGSRSVLHFITRCLSFSKTGSEAEESGSGAWNIQQSQRSPTLLPSLRFFDLVFGYQVLGKGAFSTVKYARKIVAGTPQAQWPEYAVKVVDAAKLESLHYHKEVEREMAVLRLMAHPGVCRLISSFQYKNSAYIVLEYCSRADLHRLVITKGPLSSYHTRFVIGEVAAALAYIHYQGFSFNDLKPENVLITELGHVKVADFGACRPVTKEGRDALRKSWTALADLREGDWRDSKGSSNTGSGGGGGDDDKKREMGRENKRAEIEGGEKQSGERVAPPKVWTFGMEDEDEEETDSRFGDTSDKDDENSRASSGRGEGGGGGGGGGGGASGRVEGTPAYLPPEVLTSTSARPSRPSDSWALGCVLVFCLSGRPLFYGPQAQVIEQHRHYFGARYDDLYMVGGGALGQRGQGGRDHTKTVHFSADDTKTAGAMDLENGDGAGSDGDWRTCGGASLRRQMVSGLLCLDPVHRLSVTALCEHAFLIVGDDGDGDDGDGDGSSSSSSSNSSSGSSGKASLHPLSLHSHTEPQVKIPLLAGQHQGSGDTCAMGADGAKEEAGGGDGEDSDGEEDAQWARRQFSVLWAPMPSSYDADQAGAGAGAGAGGGYVAAASAGSVPYKLSFVAETEVERGTAFVSLLL